MPVLLGRYALCAPELVAVSPRLAFKCVKDAMYAARVAVLYYRYATLRQKAEWKGVQESSWGFVYGRD